MVKTAPKAAFSHLIPPRKPLAACRCRQSVLFCPCGRALPAVAGLCRNCYTRLRNSRRRFGGNREQVLARDRFACRVCGSTHRLVVHHRRPGVHNLALLVALCAACHVRLHRSLRFRRWLPEILVGLWAEQHPGAPVQLQLDLAGGPHG